MEQIYYISYRNGATHRYPASVSCKYCCCMHLLNKINTRDDEGIWKRRRLNAPGFLFLFLVNLWLFFPFFYFFLRFRIFYFFYCYFSCCFQSRDHGPRIRESGLHSKTGLKNIVKGFIETETCLLGSTCPVILFELLYCKLQQFFSSLGWSSVVSQPI